MANSASVFMSLNNVSSDTPSHVVPSFDHRVTQWISTVMVSAGNSRNDFQFHRRSTSVPSSIVNSHLSSATCGVGPADKTGKSVVRYCPGGSFTSAGVRRPEKPREVIASEILLTQSSWLVSVLLPFREQGELVRRPIRSSGRHGRRLSIVGRKCREHTISVVRIGHVSVIVQLYAERFHVRNVDGSKQWSDIGCEGNLRHTISLQSCQHLSRREIAGVICAQAAGALMMYNRPTALEKLVGRSGVLHHALLAIRPN